MYAHVLTVSTLCLYVHLFTLHIIYNVIGTDHQNQKCRRLVKVLLDIQ